MHRQYHQGGTCIDSETVNVGRQPKGGSGGLGVWGSGGLGVWGSGGLGVWGSGGLGVWGSGVP